MDGTKEELKDKRKGSDLDIGQNGKESVMKRTTMYVALICLCFGIVLHTEAQQLNKKTPTRPRTPATRKATVAEKIFQEGICKFPSPYVWIKAYNVNNIPLTSRSDSTFVRMPDAILRVDLFLHIFAAAKVKDLYETKSYGTEVFPTAYKEHETELNRLMLKYDDVVKEKSGMAVSDSDRRALYPVIKAYIIDSAIAVQQLPKDSMRGNFAAAYKENEAAIDALAKSNPSEGLSEYSDEKEKPLFEIMAAYLFDFAGFVQASHPSDSSGNLAVAYEKDKAKIEGLAAATK
jgi:hypothetical protein